MTLCGAPVVRRYAEAHIQRALRMLALLFPRELHMALASVLPESSEGVDTGEEEGEEGGTGTRTLRALVSEALRGTASSFGLEGSVGAGVYVGMDHSEVMGRLILNSHILETPLFGGICSSAQSAGPWVCCTRVSDCAAW